MRACAPRAAPLARGATGTAYARRRARARCCAAATRPRGAVEAAKAELLQSLQGLERGAAASEEQAAEVDRLAAAVEALNPTRDPLASPLLNGQWELVRCWVRCCSQSFWLVRPLRPLVHAADSAELTVHAQIYTTSASILGLSKPKVLRPWGAIKQALDNRTLRAENLEGAPLFNAVRAKLTPRGEDDIVDVKFDTFRLLNSLKVQAPERARGWLKVTFLDEQMRVCRGDKGNLFVLTMVDRDYSLPAEGW